MQKIDTSTAHYFHLVRKAYHLADNLFSTPEIKEIYFREKELAYQDWAQYANCLFSLIDHHIQGTCGIPVFWVGLHNHFDADPHNEHPANSSKYISTRMIEAAQEFGQAFSEVVREIQDNTSSQSKAQESAQIMSEIVIQLSKQIVDLIFNDLGLKSTDLAGIY
jgi:hypothetical protein